MIIMGKAMRRTRSRAAGKGREMRRIMAICPISARAVMRNTPAPSILPALNRLEKAEPIRPSTKVETAYGGKSSDIKEIPVKSSYDGGSDSHIGAA